MKFSSLMSSALVVPLLVWILGGIFFASAARYEGLPARSPETWARWDSFQYLHIASAGYKIWREPRMAQGRVVEWRGNTAWFPLYPGVIGVLVKGGVDPAVAGRVIAELFWFFTLLVLWNTYLNRGPAGIAPLFLAAVFPGAIYFHAIFPTSMALFFMLLYLDALPKQEYVHGFLYGFLAGASYTSGLYLTGAVLLWGWTERARLDIRKPSFIVSALAPALGAALVFCIQHAQTGTWTAFFRVWEFHRYNGWSLMRLEQMLYIPTVSNPTPLTKMLVVGQSLSVFGVVLIALKYGVRTAVEKLLLITVLVFWIMPHLSPYRLSWYRAEALLLPMVVLMAGFPRRWQWAILAVWTPLAWLMAVQFFRGILV